MRLIPAENKNTAVFANTISLRKLLNTSLTEVTAVSTTNLRHEKKVVTLKKVLYAGPKLARNILTNVRPSPAQPEPKSPARLITLHRVKSFILRVLLA